jgi:hypothetical protein
MLSIHDVYAGYPGWVAMLFMEADFAVYGWLCCLANYASYTGRLAVLDMLGCFLYTCYAG